MDRAATFTGAPGQIRWKDRARVNNSSDIGPGQGENDDRRSRWVGHSLPRTGLGVVCTELELRRTEGARVSAKNVSGFAGRGNRFRSSALAGGTNASGSEHIARRAGDSAVSVFFLDARNPDQPSADPDPKRRRSLRESLKRSPAATSAWSGGALSVQIGLIRRTRWMLK